MISGEENTGGRPLAQHRAFKEHAFFCQKMREADYWPDAGLLKKIGVAPMGGKNDGASCPYLIYYIIYLRVVG